MLHYREVAGGRDIICRLVTGFLICRKGRKEGEVGGVLHFKLCDSALESVVVAGSRQTQLNCGEVATPPPLPRLLHRRWFCKRI